MNESVKVDECDHNLLQLKWIIDNSVEICSDCPQNEVLEIDGAMEL